MNIQILERDLSMPPMQSLIPKRS